MTKISEGKKAVTKTGYIPWAPSKGADAYEDDDIKKTPVFERLKADLSFDGPGGARIVLGDEQVVPIAREAIKEMWEQLQVSRFSDSICTVFDVLDANDIDHGDEIIIRRSDDGVGSYKLTKGTGRKRFGHDDYESLIGRGSDEDSDEWKEAAKALHERLNLNPEDVLHGGYLITKSQAKNPNKNGVFEFCINDALEKNVVCDKFSCRLYQYPFSGSHVQVISFPPVSGDKDKLRVDDDVTEVSSMSRMLRPSVLKGAQTPAVYFDLAKRVKDLVDEDKGEEDLENEDLANESAAHNILDDDEDE